MIGCGSSWHAAKSLAALRELERRRGDRCFRRVRGASSTAATTGSSRSRGRARRPRSAARSSASGAGTDDRRDRRRPGKPGRGRVRLGRRPELRRRPLRGPNAVRDHASSASAGLRSDSRPTACRAIAEAALAEPHPVELDTVDRAVVLGRGWRVGLADAGALALRETAQMWAESYPAMEYRHGPIATAGPGARRLAARRASHEASRRDHGDRGRPCSCRRLDPLAELIRIQRLAVALAEHRGLDPDRPPNLERAVVLDLIESGGSS